MMPLPEGKMEVTLSNTAVVLTDPQNDFLREDGVAWELVEESVKENHTIENLEILLKAAKTQKMKCFISPHYYFPHDHDWKFAAPLEEMMHSGGMYDRKGPLTMEEFHGSGADFLHSLKPYIEDGETVIASPHKIYGPQNNDLILQLRKHGIQRVILAGMSANLCLESHMREFLEQGFEVAVVTDATAAAKLPDMDAYQAAMINFRMIANAMWTTEETVEKISLS